MKETVSLLSIWTFTKPPRRETKDFGLPASDRDEVCMPSNTSAWSLNFFSDLLQDGILLISLPADSSPAPQKCTAREKLPNSSSKNRKKFKWHTSVSHLKMCSLIKTTTVSNWNLSKLHGQLIKFTNWIKLTYNVSKFLSDLNQKYLNW